MGDLHRDQRPAYIKGHTASGYDIDVAVDEDGRLITRPASYSAVGYEALTIAASALALVANVSGARAFVGRLETAQVRLRGDGIAPTAAEGELVEIGDIIILSASEILNTQFIRTGATSGVLRGTYYNAEAPTFI